MPLVNILALAALLHAAPATPLADALARVDATTFTVEAPAEPSTHDEVVVGGLIGSVAISGIPIAATVRCLTKEQCKEANPLMAKLLGPTAEGWKRATAVKVGLGAALHYGIWRLPDDTPGQRRLKRIVTYAVLAVNTVDAIRDIRVMRKIEGR